MSTYKRVLLKLSGESLGGPAGKGIDENWLAAYAEEVAEAVKNGLGQTVFLNGSHKFRPFFGHFLLQVTLNIDQAYQRFGFFIGYCITLGLVGSDHILNQNRRRVLIVFLGFTNHVCVNFFIADSFIGHIRITPCLYYIKDRYKKQG